MIVPQEPKMSKRAKIIQAVIMVTSFVLISYVIISGMLHPQTETIAPVFNLIYYIILPIFVGAFVIAIIMTIIIYLRERKNTTYVQSDVRNDKI